MNCQCHLGLWDCQHDTFHGLGLGSSCAMVERVKAQLAVYVGHTVTGMHSGLYFALTVNSCSHVGIPSCHHASSVYIQ